MLTTLGKTLIFVGLIFLIAGGIFLISEKFSFIGKLLGDVHIQRKSFELYLPLGTSILASIILSLALSLFFIFYSLIKK